MKNQNLEKNYSFKDIEDKIYKKWLDNKSFLAKVNPDKKPFCIVMPPPNVTGKLHMGHALDISIQDSIIRYKRMKGYEVLWQPGTDHAAIATEIKVTEKLKSQGIDKRELGREKFLEEAWKWKEEYEHNILTQQMKMGASCDWDKLRFTMDEGCSKAVLHTFKKMYDKGLIYNGNKIVNWCPHCHTTISDAEVEYVEKEGALYHIKYFFKDDKDKYIVVATTRPETMLGDTAVAVNPTDERYIDLIGKKLILPLVNREIEIIADDYVDKEFGTGMVKITPCHDPNDFEIGLRHNLEQIRVIDDDGNIDYKDSKYHGLDRYEARKVMVEDLKKDGYLLKVEKHMHNVGTHDRCKTDIEPMVKSQWFVKMEPLAKPAIDVVEDKTLKFIPDSFKNTYLHWLYNIKDWCISRQIWWGHRIPVYYCDDCKKMTVSENPVTECEHCHSKNIHQDEDTLDTWFSSALWPFSTLGWPNETDTYKYFYPTNVLVTGYDIIFFWVIRMVFSALEQTGTHPFDYVLIHGIVRDELGRKMSKSLNNGIDPLDIINKYGADALRMMLLTGNAPGNDMRFIEDRVEACRNFLNKVWNASRFILMNTDDNFIKKDIKEVLKDLSLEDKWILSELNESIKEIDRNLNNYELGLALDKIEKFFWESFCDWYIEISKNRLNSTDIDKKNTALNVLLYVLDNSLKLLHPFCPFVTEEIYDILHENELLISSPFPEYDKDMTYEAERNSFNYLKDVIKTIRARRTELNVPNSKKINIIVDTQNKDILDIYNSGSMYIKSLARIENIDYSDAKDIDIDKMMQLVFDKSKVYIPMADLVNKEDEIKRLTDEIEKTNFEIKRAESMLSNEKFVSKAPANKIQEEKDKLEKYKSVLSSLEDSLTKIKNI